MILGSAFVPAQVLLTILLLKSRSGRWAAIAFVAGMTVVRVLQGVIFGVVLTEEGSTSSTTSSTSTTASVLLLVLALVFFGTALKSLLAHEDADAPPPKWLTAAEAFTPVKAGLLGAGLLLVQPKFWVFTLSALSAIQAASPTRAAGTVMFLAFVVLAESLSIVAIGAAVLFPRRADSLLDASSRWLTTHNRQLVIGLGAVFGTWFAVKGLNGLGVL